MPQNQEENQSSRELPWTLTIQMIKSDVDPHGTLFLHQYGLHHWYTKRQATVESAVFGAEFVAMKQAMEVS